MVTAKGLTNGVIPMGAVLVTPEIHDAFMGGPEHMIEFFHGYTYSGNPIASAAGLATLETYKDEGLLTRGAELGAVLRARRCIRSRATARMSSTSAISAWSAPSSSSRSPARPTKRAFSAFVEGFEDGLLIRTTGDIIALSPPLIVEKQHIDDHRRRLRDILTSID